MSDIKISDLSPAGTLGGTEVLPVVQLGSTVRASVSQVGTFLTALALPLVLGSAAQPGITSLGTLSSLSVSGAVTASAVNATTLGGTLTTAAQPNVTSLGNLTSLTVVGPTGTAIIGDTLYTIHVTSGVTFLNGNLVVGGLGQFTGIVNANGGLQTAKIVGGAGVGIVFRDPSDTTNQIIVDPAGNVEVVGNATFDSDVSVTGVTTMTGRLQVNGINSQILGPWTTQDAAIGGTSVTFADGTHALYVTSGPLRSDGDIIGTAGLNITLSASFGSSVTITAGGINITGNTTLIDASAKIIPGVTSVSFRDNADAHDNLLILDNGNITVRGTLSGVTTLTVTTVTATNLAGTLTTAAQPNVTSVGTLTSLQTGPIGIGTAPLTDRALYLVGVVNTSAATTQSGLVLNPTVIAATTAEFSTIRVQFTTQAAVFTLGTGYVIHVQNPAVGAGSAITTLIGLRIDSLTSGGTNIGIQVAQGSGVNGPGIQITGGTQTGSTATAVLSLAQTWNTTGSPTAIFLGITNTASGASARLMDLQVGGASKHAVDISGNLLIAGTQVVSTRRTGWTAWTGTADRTTHATTSATLTNVAQAMKALLDDLIAHGLIGT